VTLYCPDCRRHVHPVPCDFQHEGGYVCGDLLCPECGEEVEDPDAEPFIPETAPGYREQ
jgi:hypothetical protein